MDLRTKKLIDLSKTYCTICKQKKLIQLNELLFYLSVALYFAFSCPKISLTLVSTSLASKVRFGSLNTNLIASDFDCLLMVFHDINQRFHYESTFVYLLY